VVYVYDMQREFWLNDGLEPNWKEHARQSKIAQLEAKQQTEIQVGRDGMVAALPKRHCNVPSMWS
jgi:hypothetical protein